MQLYYAPKTRSFRALWMLEEVGEPYDRVLVQLRSGEQRRDPYLAINPVGKVPALVDGDVQVFESSAIAAYLADRYAAGRLAPLPDSPQRGTYLSWLFFAGSNLEPSLIDAARDHSVDPRMAWAGVGRALAALERGLGAGPYLLGEQFTAADVGIGAILTSARDRELLGEHPTLREYADRVQSRPAWGRAQEQDVAV